MSKNVTQSKVTYLASQPIISPDYHNIVIIVSSSLSTLNTALFLSLRIESFSCSRNRIFLDPFLKDLMGSCLLLFLISFGQRHTASISTLLSSTNLFKTSIPQSHMFIRMPLRLVSLSLN